MKGSRIWFVLALVTLASIMAGNAQAATTQTDIYVAQNSAGANNGADCADAHSASWFNTSSNWGSNSGQIGAGITVHLCGTFTAPAGSSSYMSFQSGGTSGSPITLLFESGAIITATYWSGCAVTLNGHSNITVNGGTNGIIQATANGTGLANHQDNGAGLCSGSAGISNIVIENLTISDIYQHTCTEPISNCTDQGAQNTYGMDVWGGSNISIHNNTVHDMKWAIFIPYGSGASTSTNLNVYNNTIYNMDHGVVFGDEGNNSVLSSSNCSSALYNNDFSAMQPWDATSDVNHHDATHIWANNAPGSNYSGVCVYSNYFHGDAGATDNSIFGMESLGSGNYTFNNVIVVSGYSACASGAIGTWTGTGSHSTGHHVFNNTVLPTASCADAVNFEQTAGDVLENNLVLSGNATYVYTDGVSGDLATADYNSYASPAGGNPFYGPAGCPSGASFATWKSGCGFDTHGQQTTITVNSDNTLPSGSPAIGAATNLNSLGLTALGTGAPQTFGATGTCGTGCVVRSSTAAWDAGAYPYGTNTGAPNPPSGLASVVIQ